MDAPRGRSGGRAGSASLCSRHSPWLIPLLLYETLVLNVAVMTAGSRDEGITASQGNTMEVLDNVLLSLIFCWIVQKTEKSRFIHSSARRDREEAQPRGPGPGFHNLM